MGKTKIYAVRKGREPGIYYRWDQCERQAKGFKGAEYKSFSSIEEAHEYMTGVKTSSKTDILLHTRESGIAKPQVQTNSLHKEALKEYTSASNSNSNSTGESVVYHLEFDGASKGNPGKAGAGAMLKHSNGSVECELSEGLGFATNNVAEYRGLILGLRTALERGVKRISVKGDSKLVCQQVMGKWLVKNEGLKPLHQEVIYLKSKFTEFAIQHVDREYNPRADALANIGVSMPEIAFVSSQKI